MKRSILITALALVGAAFIVAPGAFTACSPTPAPRPLASDSGPEPSSAETCLHLAQVCGIGAEACQAKLDQVEADRLTVFPRSCWLRGATPAAVKACGQITCAGPLP